MPKGKRETALVNLVNELDKLDVRRRDLVAQIQAAAVNLASGSAGTSSAFTRKRGGGRRKGFRLSAEARARISAAQKKRWAAQKKNEK